MMNLETVATALSVAGMVFFLFLQPLKVQLQNLADTLQEVKAIIENYRADVGHMSSELAVHDRDIKALWKRIDKMEARLNDMNERGCCRDVEQD